jgi:cephalosporin hydroxylase
MAVGADGDTYENDPARWGHSLANMAEIMFGCLDASGAKSVAEVGAYAGDLTRVLLDWAAAVGGRVVAIEPTPQPHLVELSERHPELELIRETSHTALRHLPLPDAVIIDGDHNYYTVSEELRLIDEKAPGPEIPLLMFHDVGWPHGRRDAYWTPERIPEGHRQSTVKRPFLFPGEPGVVDEGMPMYSAAAREGGPRNGVLTALEDFLDRREDLRLATLPPFFGFGVVWHRDAPGARAVAEFVDPWDRNPVLERLEANRVYHLATSHARSLKLLRAGAELKSQQEENAKLERLAEERELELERLRSKSSGQVDDGKTDQPVSSSAVNGRTGGGQGDSATDSATIRWFHELWFRRRPVFKNTFLGVAAWQNPLDAWITQEIVSEVRPDLIIETGTFRGGSAALWAFLLEVANPTGRVVTIDVDDTRDPRVQGLDVVKRRVEFLQGSSTDPKVVREVARRADGRKVLAILDSDHSAKHVLGELTAYAPLISVGSYIIVQDVLAGPGTAIERFLQQDDRFEPDPARERFMITNCARGFLRRMR